MLDKESVNKLSIFSRRTYVFKITYINLANYHKKYQTAGEIVQPIKKICMHLVKA